MEKRSCNDFYGERLKIGDKVLSVFPGSKFESQEGTICEISYLEETDQYFITTIDNEGKILTKNVNSIYFSTSERINEYGNDYIFSLSFISKEGKVISNKPLTTQTDLSFQIPQKTLWIDLKINKLTKDRNYERYSLFVFIVDSDLTSHFEKQNGKYCIATSKFVYYPNFSDSNLVVFKSQEELQLFIKVLIDFFHNNPLGQANNQKIYDENIEANKLSKKLAKLISSRIPSK